MSSWDKLLSHTAIKAGWHLTRDDAKKDFEEDFPAIDVFGEFLEENVRNILARIVDGRYLPSAVRHIRIPKAELATRPGCNIPISDRTVLFACVRLIAQAADKHLPRGVYSYRVKESLKANEKDIFKTSDILNLPFIKKKEFRAHVDPFDPWYQLWPEFDKSSLYTVEKTDFKYLLITDIAGYFENINIDYLYTQLNQLLVNEEKLINFVLMHFSSWCRESEFGDRTHRGIPQGNSVSSFFGNLFLLPLDKRFADDPKYRYFRYMDDVRVFAKTRDDAKAALFAMEDVVRSLGLSLQSAKTKILHGDEVVDHLVDPRIETCAALRAQIEAWKKDGSYWAQKAHVREALRKIAKFKPKDGSPAFMGAHSALTGLGSRAFRMWMSVCVEGRHPIFLDRLLREIERTPDVRLVNVLRRVVQEFPKHTAIGLKVLHILQNGEHAFSHHKGELLRAIRCLSQLPVEAKKYCLDRVLDPSEDVYLAYQSALLLQRFQLTKSDRKKIEEAMRLRNNPRLQIALAMLLHEADAAMIMKTRTWLSRNRNDEIRSYFSYLVDKSQTLVKANYLFDRALSEKYYWTAPEYIGPLFYIAANGTQQVREKLRDKLKWAVKKHPIVGIRARLEDVSSRSDW